MIRNFIRLAWRNLLANKVYSVINIVGLAVGLAVCILLMLYITDETGYDRSTRGRTGFTGSIRLLKARWTMESWRPPMDYWR